MAAALRILAQEGFDLVLVARSERKLQALKEELETTCGIESAASMGSGSSMFHHAAVAAEVTRDGYKAMRAGKAVCLQGAFTKAMSFGSRLVPRSIARKVAMRMNR